MPAPFLSNTAAFILVLTSMFGNAGSGGSQAENPGEAHEPDRTAAAERTRVPDRASGDRVETRSAEPLLPDQAESSARRRAAAHRVHAQRIARLERIETLAERRGRSDLVTRVRIAREKETTRHARALARIEDAVNHNGL